MIAAFDQLRRQIEVAGTAPVTEDQHRDEGGQQAEDAVDGGEAGVMAMHREAGNRQQQRRSGKEVLRSLAGTQPVDPACQGSRTTDSGIRARVRPCWRPSVLVCVLLATACGRPSSAR